MKVKEFINELKYYQMFLGEIISAYYINEAICDFAEKTIVPLLGMVTV